MTKILAARHGDAALDAVGIVHRLLWMRPDATRAERDSIAARSVRVDIASGQQRASSDDDEANETEASNETSHEPNLSDDENMYDLTICGTGTRRGYVTNDRDDGGPFHPFRRRESNLEEIAAESAAEAEEVSINGFIAAI